MNPSDKNKKIPYTKNDANYKNEKKQCSILDISNKNN